MKISNINSQYNFKGATININALADTHGHIEYADAAYQTLMKEDAFEKERRGTANYLITGGDWFMSGDKKGYKSAPDKPLVDFQTDMYNKFVGTIKKNFPKLKALFIPGNHEFDGGMETFKSTVDKIDSTVIMSNIETETSSALEKEITDGHIVKSTIDFVQDDKKNDVYYPVLNIGISPVNMRYYKSDISGIDFINNIPLAQKKVHPSQYSSTTSKIHDMVKDFRNKYDNGIVVLTSHTGVDFAQTIAQQGGIDIIFNAHEHKNEVENVNGVPIINLSQNFAKVVNTKININDDGKISDIKCKDLYPKKECFKTESEIGKFYEDLFKEDSKKIYTIKCSDPNITEFGTEGIRKGPSLLANFVTDILLEEAKEHDPNIDIFALNASAIRGGFNVGGNEPNTTNVQVLNCLDGITSSHGEIFVTDVTGEELAMMLTDNFLFNMIDREKNPMIHYSGIAVDRTGLLAAYHNGSDFKDLCKYISSTYTGFDINPEKKYRIANPLKYFEKAQIEQIKEMKSKSQSLHCEIHELFNDYFKKHNVITYTPEERLF
ncbi:metallophosphoesterase [bacterium]|nr:metallophosphoesterase [bacterium]